MVIKYIVSNRKVLRFFASSNYSTNICFFIQVLVQYGFPTEIQRWIIGKRLPKDPESLEQCGVNTSGASIFLYLLSAKSLELSRGAFVEKYGTIVPSGVYLFILFLFEEHLYPACFTHRWHHRIPAM